MRVHSLGRDDPLEESIATHSSTLAWEDPIGRAAWRATGPQSCGVRPD